MIKFAQKEKELNHFNCMLCDIYIYNLTTCDDLVGKLILKPFIEYLILIEQITIQLKFLLLFGKFNHGFCLYVKTCL